MRNLLLTSIVICLIVTACSTKTESFSDQLRENFITHLIKKDSSLELNSFIVLRVDTINQRLFSFVNDTLYKLSIGAVQKQLAHAAENNNIDSMAFYQSELDYMLPTSDSISREIYKADTVKKYGLLATCQVQISRGSEKATDTMYYFLDKKMTVRSSELIDSLLTALTLKMKTP